MKTLVYGYGNPGRQDDGLGVVCAEEIEKWIKAEGISDIETDSNYQLNIEDAATIAAYDRVIFIDATIEPINDILFTKVDASEAHIEFTMHAVSPSFVVDLCNKIYQKTPDVWLMHIKGYEWELAEGLTEKGKINLEKSLKFLKEELKSQKYFSNQSS